MKSAVFNLKRLSGSAKGRIGELLAKREIKYSHSTKELSPSSLDAFPFSVPEEIKKYLLKNWYSLDLFSFVLDENLIVQNLCIYEVKVRNYTHLLEPRYSKSLLTNNCLNVYREALSLGFSVKHVEVILLDDWNYYLTIKDFDIDNFYISDGTPKYAKK